MPTSLPVNEYAVLNGLVVQGGAEAVKTYYNRARAEPTNEGAPPSLTIVNVARRRGEATAQQLPGGRILWLPMLEGEHARCSAYVDEHGPALLETLAAGGTVVVNCQEGLHRSVDFARRLRAKAGAPMDSVLDAQDPALQRDARDLARAFWRTADGAIIEEGDKDEDLDDRSPT